MIRLFADNNPFGKASISGMQEAVGVNRLRRVAHGRKNFYHRSRNGVYDPITFYRILDTLLSIEPGQFFRTTDLITILRIEHPSMVWDPTTVGRVVTDIADSLMEANGQAALKFTRRYNGMTYYVEDSTEGRWAMLNLLDDLYRLCEDEIEAESQGEFPKRVSSPLERCPSLMAALGETQ